MISNNLPQLYDVMKASRCDALLITSIENIRYITGFTGSSGFLLAKDDGGIFFTDSRYMEQAGEEVRGYEVREYKKRFPDLASAIVRAGLKRVGFEDSDLTYQSYQELKKELGTVRLVPLKKSLNLLRSVKTNGELRLISKAIDIAYGAFERLIPSIKAGVEEDDLAIELEYLMRKGGAEGISFDVIVASGDRSALPHGRAGNKLLKTGDPVVFDFGARYRGYHSDETATIFVGKVKEEHRKIYNIVKDAHDRAIDLVKPGTKCSDIDKGARDFIGQAGYGEYFGHGTGHGVGINVHEGPYISPNSESIVEEGMVFTIEPGIYIPGVGGVRIEDMVLVTNDGSRILTRIPKELTII